MQRGEAGNGLAESARQCVPTPLFGAASGYPLRIVSSTAFAPEKIQTMRAFGADVELIDSPEGITPTLIPTMRARAAEIVAETGGYATDQFHNVDMVDGYRPLGDELVAQLDGRIDAIVIYVGTAGCYLGVTRAWRVARAVRRQPRDAPHRGWRGGVRAAAALTR